MHRILGTILVGIFVTATPATAQTSDAIVYDIVIENGRAMDPETGLDAVRNIGISAGTIATITTEAISGKRVIDAQDHVVAPGFIDIHNHSPTPLGLSYQARDGVTTTLELEVGSYPLNNFGKMIRGKAIINYGASASSLNARIATMTDFRQSNILGAPKKAEDVATADVRSFDQAFTAQANAAEIATLRNKLTAALDNGAIGIGIPLDYVSVAVKAPELQMMFELGAAYNVPLFIHIRRGIAGDPSGLEEVLALAKTNGTKILICHLSHNAMQNVALFLDKIRTSRADGVDVTAEVLPFNAGSTSTGAAVFGRDWRRIFNIDYKDVQLASTGEWFTKESFQKTRKEDPNAAIIHHYLKEEWTRYLVTAPDVIISSDGLPIISASSNVPPQGVGSFSKILGQDRKSTRLNSSL